MFFLAQRSRLQCWHSTTGKVGIVLMLALIGLALSAPLLHPYDPAIAGNYLIRLQPPSSTHWFGTDGLGRDVLIQTWYGLRTSLMVSLVSVSLGAGLGVGLGLVAGYFRGYLELAIGWCTDVLLAFPSILLAIAVVTVTGPSLSSVMLAVGLVQIPIYSRLTRSMVLFLREQDYVLAVQALGAHPWTILWRHILPASLPPIVVQASLSIGTATLEAAGLGFLGLGAQPPTPELGTMLADAFKGGYSLSSPWTMVFPGLLITLMVLVFNLMGDRWRDLLDPHSTIDQPPQT